MFKYKIALVSAFPPSTGSLNEYGFHMAQELARRDDVEEVVVLADTLGNAIDEPDHGAKIRVVRCWTFNEVFTAFKLVSTLRREQVDGVIFNVQTASFGDREAPAALGLAAPMIARLAGIKSGALVHNLIEGIDLEGTVLKGNWLRQKLVQTGGWFVSFVLARANYVTTTLDQYANILKSRFPNANIFMVPHGAFSRPEIDLPTFTSRRKRIVTMGKYGTYKRLETLIGAFLKLHEEDRELELIIGGADHPNTPGYMAGLEAEHGHVDAIKFAGYIAEEDVPEFFANARLAVFDYNATTGSSGVLHQCASYGAVPIFPNIGDFVEVCRDEGVGGYHYQAGDVGSMAQTIRQALEQEVQSAAIAKQNFAAVDEYPLSKVLDFHIRQLVGAQAGAA